MSDKEEEELRCVAKTSSGERCKNKALYPEDDPKYCGIHYDGDDNDDDEENNNNNDRVRKIIYN